ncbi:MAG: TolC family protein, partial [Gemmatimonadales bacterium]|nr:TolC family protein [Gemmatimonadales bacterium]
RRAYYELAFLDQATEIVGRNQDLLDNLIRLTEARYAVGTGAQTDVLTARVEMARLAEQAVTLAERRRAALARLNAAMDRPSEMPIEAPDIPVRIARAAVADDHAQVRFVSAALGSRAADSPLPPLLELQETALRLSPSILAHQAMIDAQGARVALARKEHLPDFDLSLQYGQRDGRSDMVSAMVSISLPLRKSQRQDLLVREAEARLAALHAEHARQANDLRAEIASAYSDLERERAQLALFVKSIIPQGRAALESATASYQVGRVGFLALLESQATLYGYETQYHRALADFASRLAELERVVGGEVLR